VWLNIDKTLSLSNKLEFTSLKSGVKNTIEWQKNNLF